MTQSFNLPTFFRQVPKPLLKEYFEKRGLLAGLELDELKRRDVRPIQDAFDALPDDARQQAEQDFHDVFLLSNKAGTETITGLADYFNLGLADRLEAMDGHYARAMWLFLNPEPDGVPLWNECLALAEMKALPFSRAKGTRNLPRVEPRTGEDAIEGLENAVKALYREQGRGHRCVFEHRYSPNPVRHFFHGYPEDYAATHLDYEDERLRRRLMKPVFEVGFVYEPEAGYMELAAPGGAKEAKALREAFFTHILGLGPNAVKGDEKCFNLDLLREPGFEFALEADDDIAGVDVLSLRLAQPDSPGHRITYEADPDTGMSIHDFIRWALNEQNLPLHTLNVTAARLCIRWNAGKGRAPQATFTLTWPNGTSLGHSPRDLKVRKLLKRWRIAP